MARVRGRVSSRLGSEGTCVARVNTMPDGAEPPFPDAASPRDALLSPDSSLASGRSFAPAPSIASVRSLASARPFVSGLLASGRVAVECPKSAALGLSSQRGLRMWPSSNGLR